MYKNGGRYGGYKDDFDYSNANIPPRDYLITINLLGEKKCYLGIDSRDKYSFILGKSLL